MALLSIATSASNVDKGLVNVNITVDGFPVTVGVSSVIIHHELNQISYAELVLIGDDKNQISPKMTRRENAVEVKIPRERVIVGDIQTFLNTSKNKTNYRS
jgi:hypothetical protein